MESVAHDNCRVFGCIKLTSILEVFWQWGPLIFVTKKATRMQHSSDGTITYKNKRCSDGLPVSNGMTGKGAEGEEGRGCSYEVQTWSVRDLQSACHTLSTTRGQVGNGTNPIKIRSQATKSPDNPERAKTFLIKISRKYASKKDWASAGIFS